MIIPTRRERTTYLMVCALWRAWRAPALLADLARSDEATEETVKKRLQRLKEKGWIRICGERRSKGRGWVPTCQALACDRLDEIMALVVSVAGSGVMSLDRANGLRLRAVDLLSSLQWFEQNPTNPST